YLRQSHPTGGPSCPATPPSSAVSSQKVAGKGGGNHGRDAGKRDAAPGKTSRCGWGCGRAEWEGGKPHGNHQRVLGKRDAGVHRLGCCPGRCHPLHPPAIQTVLPSPRTAAPAAGPAPAANRCARRSPRWKRERNG
ncbi:hypothetical protein M959_00760, partial [Chaetura pelagica]